MNVKRKYNLFTQNDRIEDYSIRYVPSSFRKWGYATIAITAMSGQVYLVDLAIGGSLISTYGFLNTLISFILAFTTMFFVSIPIVYYTSKYNISTDLLTRAAGFGYIGSTITSLIYAVATLVFFSLEGAIMADAISLFTPLPIYISYAIAALIVYPITFYGISIISKFQPYSLLIWIPLFILPLIGISVKDPSLFYTWESFKGTLGVTSINITYISVEFAVLFSLVTGAAELADFLRFFPDNNSKISNKKYWFWVLLGGSSWFLIFAFPKELYGSLLATYIYPIVGYSGMSNPIIQLVYGIETLTSNHVIIGLYILFIAIISQIKINISNAYSASLALSNFFSRIFHIHPGRAIWLLLAILIGLASMEAGIFGILDLILSIVGGLIMAWFMSIISDLTINMKLKLRPQYIDFKRGHLYNINPVGFVPTMIAAIITILANLGFLGYTIETYSIFIAAAIGIIGPPIIAYITKGKYYVAREDQYSTKLLQKSKEKEQCVVCGFHYEKPDMLFCPYHKGPICSLCCTLDKSCKEVCKHDSLPKSFRL